MGKDAGNAVDSDKTANVGNSGTYSTKTGGLPDVPQIDTGAALNYFQQAADAVQTGYTTGQNAYSSDINVAINNINSAATTANNTLLPLSQSAGEALNQQMRMLGMDPVQATVGFGDALNTSFKQVANTLPDDAGSYISNLANQLNSATSIQDPTARAAAQANISSMFGDGYQQNVINPIQNQINNLKAPTAPAPEDINAYNTQQQNQINSGSFGDLTAMAQQQQDKSFSENQLDENAAYQNGTLSQYNGALQNYNSQMTSLQANLTAAQNYGQTLSSFGQTWSQQYSPTYDSAYTPDQVNQQVANLPGYQFNMDQGVQAIDRSAAASGLLNSGNTGIALQTYGQGLASNYFNQYMQYLQGVTSTGTPATMQISANQTAQGNNLASLAQANGAAVMSTDQAIANAQANTYMTSGNTTEQAAQYNASNIFAEELATQGYNSSAANQGIASAGGLLSGAANVENANLANTKFAQSLVSSANQGAGLAQGLL